MDTLPAPREDASEPDGPIGPKPLQSNFPWWLAGYQFRPGAESPSVAKATKTREALRRQRVLQLNRRGHRGLAVHIALAS